MSDDVPAIEGRLKNTFKASNPIDRQELERRVTSLAMSRALFDRADCAENKFVEARQIVAMSLQLAAYLAGDEVIELVHGTSMDEHPDHLGTIRERLLPLMFFYGTRRMTPDDPAGLTAVLQEIDAIRHGDEPRLFGKVAKLALRGRPNNARRMAKHKLRALQWAAFLQAQGLEPADWQFRLHSAFGSAWPVIRQWRDEVVNQWGLEMAETQIEYARRGLPPFDGTWSREEWEGQLARDGRDFNWESWRGARPK